MSCHRPAVPARAGSPASRPFPDPKAKGSFSSPGAACCIFPRQAPVEPSDRHVPFLKALSTGASTVLSQAEGMPRHRGFRSMRVYYTMLWRQALARNRQHPTHPTLISQRMLCVPRGDARAKSLSLNAGFSRHADNTRLRQAATAAHRTDSDIPATAMLSQRFSAWHESHFAAASSARLCLFAL